MSRVYVRSAKSQGCGGRSCWWRRRKTVHAAGWLRLCAETMAGGGLCKFCATLARPEGCPVLQAIPQSETYFSKLALIALPLILSILPTTLTLNLPGPILEAELPGNFCLTSKMKTAYLSADSLFKMNYIKCTVQKNARVILYRQVTSNPEEYTMVLKWYWKTLYYNIIFCNTDLMRELKFLIIM